MLSRKADPHTPFLVAESSPVLLSTIKEYFDDFLFEDITFVKDGYELFATVHKKKYEAIILDHHLRKSNTLNAIADTLNSGINSETPVIFTYDNNIEKEEKKYILDNAKSVGVSAIINKPFSKETLWTTIENVLDIFIIPASEQIMRSKKSLAATKTAISLANNFRESGEFEKSEIVYLEATMNVLYGIAEAYLLSGKLDDCDSVLTEALQIDPQAKQKFKGRTKNFISRGNENLKKNRHRLAIFEFEAATYLMPESQGALVGLGEALLALNEKAVALKSFKRVLTIKPNKEARDLYKRIGTILFRLKEYEIAVKAFETAAIFIKTDPELYYFQSLMDVALGKFPEALVSIDKALKLKVPFFEAQKAREKILVWVKAAEEKNIQASTATS